MIGDHVLLVVLLMLSDSDLALVTAIGYSQWYSLVLGIDGDMPAVILMPLVVSCFPLSVTALPAGPPLPERRHSARVGVLHELVFPRPWDGFRRQLHAHSTAVLLLH